jgi:predicted phage-related endonuclease
MVGASIYTSALQLFAEKTKLIPRGEIDNEAIRWGNRLERPIAEQFAEDTGYALVEWPVTLRLKSHPWMLANLDFLRVTPNADFPAGQVTMRRGIVPPEGILAIVEIKSSGIVGFGTGHHWGDDDDPKIPIGYELQCRHYELVSGIREAYLVGLLGGRGLTIRNVPWDDDYAEYLLDIESRFWNEHILTGIPPEPDGSESANETLKSLYPRGDEEKEAEGGSKLSNLWHDLEKAKVSFAEVETEKKRLRAQIVAIIGNAAYGTVFGERICSFKNSQDSEEFDEKGFALANPEEYKKWLKKKPGFRTLRSAK